MDTIDIFYKIIRSVTSFLSIGNVFVIILIIKFEYLRTKQNAFILLLAVCDSMYGLILLPSTMILDAVYKPNMTDSVHEPWLAACKFRCFVNTLAFYGDYLSIAVITLDRFW